MASPDVVAADYTPQWRSRPIPRPGDHIKMVALVRTDASHFMSERHVSGVVDSVTVRGNLGHDLIITLTDDLTEYILRQSTPTCDWALQAAAGHELIAPAPESPVDATPLESMSIVALERRLLAVKNRLAAIDGEGKALEAEAAQLSRLIRDTALEQEMGSLPAVDGMTAYFKPAYFVERKVDEKTGEPFTSQDIAAALKECGHGYLLSEGFNGNQLRALIREIKIDHKRPLPPPLARVVSLGQRFDVAFTPMGERKRRAAPQREQ